MAELLKDRFMTDESLNEFSSIITKYFPEFNTSTFLADVQDENWKGLELKEKMRHITKCLHKQLPDSYAKAVEVLKKAAYEVKGFESMCLPDYVELYGLEEWDVSLPAMHHFTQFSSSEFAIRPYLIKDIEKTMEFMSSCANDDKKNVRRFASEGCRPRLPWAMAVHALKKDPSLILLVLEKLKDDESEFVRRSVANNLNDISKDHPDIVLKIAEEWLGYSENRDKLVKHALRTLLKAGNSKAMILFGFGDPVNLDIEKFTLGQDSIKIDEESRFNFDLVVKESDVKVRLEYAVYYQKARGKISKKVFKIGEKKYKEGICAINRKYGFVNQSTRKIYPGKHEIGIVVNGVEKAKASIEVVE